MSPKTPKDPGQLGDDAQSRIEELEAQVQELSGLVEHMLEQSEERETFDVESSVIPDEHPEERRHPIIDGVREGMGRALGGEEGESLESKIGGIWLSRVAAVLFLTAIVLGGAMTLRDDALLPIHKLGVGYGVSLIAIAYGLIVRKRQNLFAQTMLGSGLAALYFTTYAGFFIEATIVFRNQSAALPVLGACLLFLAIVAHYRRSQTVAGISLFLIYYTVVLSLSEERSLDNVVYAIITCSLVSVLALVFHATHRWLFFTWGALVATHLTYLYFFFIKPPELEISDEAYFWLANGFLALTWVIFSTACITDARRTGEFRRLVAPMSGVNSAVFLVLSWFAVRAQYPEHEGDFRLAIAAALGLFALYAAIAGPKRNYLFQIFIAKTVVMTTLALQAYLSNEWLLVAMSIECLGLAFSHQRSGLVIFKLMGLALLLVVFTSCIVALRVPGEVILWNYTVPAKWFSCVAVPLILAVVAWFYEHFVRPVPPEEREVRGQWFLADTFLDLRSSTVALLHAAAGAFILLAITVIELGAEPSLPYILAGESIAMVVLGLLLRTASVEVAGVLLLVAAHVCYHVFLAVGKPGFESQDQFLLYTVLIALYTYVGGYVWERYLRRIPQGGSRALSFHGNMWEHYAIAALPYLAATIMLTTLMQRYMHVLQVPVADNALAVLLLLVAALSSLSGLFLSSVLALAMGVTIFYTGLYNIEAPFAEMENFFAHLLAFLGTLVVSERLISRWKSEDPKVESIGRGMRTLLVTLGTLLGVLALWEWSEKAQLTFYLGGLAAVGMALGVLFRESAYRWAAMIVYFCAIIRAYLYDLINLNPVFQFLSFAALCIPLLVISWGYSQYRLRFLQKLEPRQNDAATSDG